MALGKVLAKRVLLPHHAQAHPPLDIGAKVTLLGTDVLKLDYVIVGEIGDLLIPERTDPARCDGLWQHTCFEVFIGLADDSAYVEYNFAPSGEWASYRFTGYRDGMVEAIDLPEPDIFVEQIGGRRFSQTVILDASSLFRSGCVSLGLSAVIEAWDKGKSYWALAHPPGKPDFHHRDCFALQLPAAGQE